MAKKQSLSYGPNMGLIAGEAQVAASETALANVNQSFVTGAASMFGAIQQANKERDAKMEAYETQVGGLPDINQFEDPENKQKIKNFLNTQRDEYVRLADLYENTKDRDVKDKMEQIKFSLVNLNDQIKTFNQDKLDYRTANEENQLASLRTYQEKDGTDFFTNAFTNNAAFSIDEQGDMVFGINKNSYKYKDKAGKWNSKNNIDESNVLSIYSEVYKSGGKGDKFNTDNVRRGLYNSFKNTGNSALQVFATTDLTSDTSDLSFEAQFASGSLKEKHPEMYKGFTAESNGTYDTNWMFDNKNGDILRNKVSDYFTKVMEDGHGQGRSDNYTPISIEKSKFGLTLDKNYYSIMEGKDAVYVDGQTIANTVETFKSIQDKGSGDFKGYGIPPHRLIKEKWFMYNDESKKFDKPSTAESIFNALRWTNNPKIMDYLKIEFQTY